MNWGVGGFGQRNGKSRLAGLSGRDESIEGFESDVGGWDGDAPFNDGGVAHRLFGDWGACACAVGEEERVVPGSSVAEGWA